MRQLPQLNPVCAASGWIWSQQCVLKATAWCFLPCCNPYRSFRKEPIALLVSTGHGNFWIWLVLKNLLEDLEGSKTTYEFGRRDIRSHYYRHQSAHEIKSARPNVLLLCNEGERANRLQHSQIKGHSNCQNSANKVPPNMYTLTHTHARESGWGHETYPRFFCSASCFEPSLISPHFPLIYLAFFLHPMFLSVPDNHSLILWL